MTDYPDFNLISVTGNIVRDPEQSTNPTSQAVTIKTALAQNKPFCREGQNNSQFYNLALYTSKLSTGFISWFLKNVHKGTRLTVVGELQLDNKEITILNDDGSKRSGYQTWVTLIVTNAYFAGSPKKAQEEEEEDAAPVLAPTRAKAVDAVDVDGFKPRAARPRPAPASSPY